MIFGTGLGSRKGGGHGLNPSALGPRDMEKKGDSYRDQSQSGCVSVFSPLLSSLEKMSLCLVSYPSKRIEDLGSQATVQKSQSRAPPPL